MLHKSHCQQTACCLHCDNAASLLSAVCTASHLPSDTLRVEAALVTRQAQWLTVSAAAVARLDSRRSCSTTACSASFLCTCSQASGMSVATAPAFRTQCRSASEHCGLCGLDEGQQPCKPSGRTCVKSVACLMAGSLKNVLQGAHPKTDLHSFANRAAWPPWLPAPPGPGAPMTTAVQGEACSTADERSVLQERLARPRTPSHG